VDLKAAVLGLEVVGAAEARFTLRAGNEASAKPTEVLAAVFGGAEGVRVLKDEVTFAAAAPGGGENEEAVSGA
jgi:hypothetical protein